MTGSDDRRFRELLPYLVNDTLAGEDRIFVEDYLLRHPQASAEVKFTELMRDALLPPPAESAPDQGLDRLLEQVRAEAPASTQAYAWSQRGRRRLTRAFVAAAAVVVIQAGILVSIEMRGPPGEVTRGYGSAVKAGFTQGPALRVTFKSSVEFGSILSLVHGDAGTMVSGPDETGAVVIAFPPQTDAEAERKRLIASGMVDDAVPLKP